LFSKHTIPRNLHPDLTNSALAMNRSRRLWQQIGFLGCFQTAYDVFVQASATLFRFENVAIFSIPPGKTRNDPPSATLTLDQSTMVFSENINLNSFWILLSKKRRTPPEAREEFSGIQKSPLYAQAEIQMILHLGVENQTGRASDYLGYGKHSCSMCWNFTQACGVMRTRGCSGSLPIGRTILETKSLPRVDVGKTVKVTQMTINKLKHELPSPFEDQPPEIAQLSVGSVNADLEASPTSFDNKMVPPYLFFQAHKSRHDGLSSALRRY
jgi:hypothetical protein